VVRDEAALAAALALPGCELELPAERAAAGTAARALWLAPGRAVLRAAPRALLSATLAEGLPPAELAGLAAAARAEGLPRCLAPRSAPPRAILHAGTLRPDGRIDLLAWAGRYVAEGVRTRSLRCRGCAEAAACSGAHLNEVRAHGFAFMRPVGAA
jgi:hypothetical protein